jgi:RNA polymerase sigma factor (TIGR02999 family)
MLSDFQHIKASGDDAVTSLLADWKSGKKEALDQLVPIVYDELRRLAAHYLRGEKQAVTVQATAVVHEAWLRLAGQNLPDWESRSHFFGVAARLMRQILVDRARERRAVKRGSGADKVSLDEALHGSSGNDRDVVALGEALDALAKFDERKCKVVELRFFGGLSMEETAQALGISLATVGREQRLAEAWLHREMSAG